MNLINQLIALGATLLMSSHGFALGSGQFQCASEQNYLRQRLKYEANAWQYNDDCFVSLDQVDPTQFMLIDSRPHLQWIAGMVPGALHLPGRQLFFKQALKQQPILVLGDGSNPAGLARFCSEARRAGFEKLSILQGGMNAWFLAGQPFQSHDQVNTGLQAVDLSRFLQSAHSRRSYLLVDHESYPLLRQLLPDTNQLLAKASYQSWDDSIRQLIVERDINLLTTPLLLVTDNPDELAYSTSRWHRYTGLYRLTASTRELAQFVEETDLVLQAKEAIPNRYRCSR